MSTPLSMIAMRMPAPALSIPTWVHASGHVVQRQRVVEHQVELADGVDLADSGDRASRPALASSIWTTSGVADVLDGSR